MKDVRRLTLEEKVGQLFFLGFQGFAPDTETLARIERIRPAGFIFSQRNIDTFDQFSALTSQFQQFNGLPNFLAVDSEGGRVDRLKHVFSPIPSMAELASAGTAPVRAGARIIAAELEAAGLNLDFAPVLDLAYPDSVIYERAISSNPVEVARLGAAFIDELSKKSILACVKHFPGLGAARLDPHFVLPPISRTKRQLQQEDALPFLNLIDDVGMMMVSHAHYPAFGDEKPTPASLSVRIVEGFLRKKLGFQGVIMTDDLTMGAISAIGLTPELFLRAFEAGNDLLLFSQCTPLVEQAFRLILRTARKNEALRSRIDQSVYRIVELKTRIQYTPVRYRAHIRSRINRQIEKLRTEIAVS